MSGFCNYFCYMVHLIKDGFNYKYGNATKVAAYIGVHKNTISRWIKAGDRRVIKNGYEIYLNIDKL